MSKAAYERFEHVGTAPAAQLSGSISSSATSIVCDDLTGWPTGSSNRFWVVLGRGTSSEEKVIVETRTSNTLALTDVSDRGEDGTSAAAHASGTTIEHVAAAAEVDDMNVAATLMPGAIAAKGDLLAGTGSQAADNLTVGSNGEVLLAASGEATGLEWGQVDTGGIADDAVTLAKIADAAVPMWMLAGWFRATDEGTGTPQHMYRMGDLGVSGAEAVLTGGIAMPVAGSIIGISARTTTARTGGSLTFEVYKNGSGTGLSTTIDDDPTQNAYATQARGTDTFAAGDTLSVWFTGSSFTPTTNVEAAILVSL